MNKRNPFSAIYYMKENKGRCFIGVFMMVLATLMFLSGNYIQSVIYPFHKEFEYSNQVVVAGIQPTDEEYKDFAAFKKLVQEDPKLNYVDVTALGFSGMQHQTVLNLEMGGWSYVFNSVDDMKKVFNHLGIEGDFSNCKHRSMVISQDFANNKGIKLGDKLDETFDSVLDGVYTVDAIIDDGSFCTFYVYEDDENLGRLYIYSDTMVGKELYDYVRDLAKDKKVQISETEEASFMGQIKIFFVLFYLIDILIAIVLAVTVNSVITGQYIKRIYEFGVYRALGRSKWDVKKKVIAEVFVMNAIACIIGAGIMLTYTYIINELYYVPKGEYLMFASQTGMVGFMICDLLIVIPLVLSKGRMMSRADVTAF
ncbi:MAG: ABC transporter permease [Eubacteriales bacterium]|nr:ABC transporter permease [Eubacteriales bacterium]